VHIYRWDLDKTYLETDFHSLRGLMRSATEPASAKITAPGAAPILRALSQEPQNRVVIVSGSPTQMREVLESKLRLDGVRFDRLILKDNWGNLKKGRVRAIRGQFGYKLPELLALREEAPDLDLQETLFGDDAEVDALVYAVYADALAGRISGPQLAEILKAGGAYEDQIEGSLRSLARIPGKEVVDRIFIRLAQSSAPARFQPLGGRVVPIHSWLQAALVLFQDGHLGLPALLSCGEEVAEKLGNSRAVGALVQDVVRRGLVDRATVLDAPWEQSIKIEVESSLSRMAPLTLPRPVGPPLQLPDYRALISAWAKKDPSGTP
jgi:hypothetical protein